MLAMFYVYLAGIVSNISLILAVVGIVSGILAAVALMGYSDGVESCLNWFKKALVICIISAFMWALIPNQKTMYYMAGAYIGSEIVQSETAGKVVKLINSQLDDYIEELSVKKSKNGK